MKKYLFVALAISSTVFYGCGNDDAQPEMYQDNAGSSSETISADTAKQESITLSTTQQQYVKTGNDFALHLFGKVASEEKGSFVLTPLSAANLLGMSANGATEQTLSEIKKVMGMENVQVDELNSYFNLLSHSLTRLDDNVDLVLSNAVIANADPRLHFQLSGDFCKVIAREYDAEKIETDFRNPQSLERINSWVTKSTMGEIRDMLSELDDEGVLYALNAIFFKGKWTLPFDKANTKEETFGERAEKIPMMQYDGSLTYSENQYAQALWLPYGKGAFSMMVVLPREDTTVGELAAKFDASTLQRLMASRQTLNVDLKLPRFETESNLVLNHVLSELGLPSAFNMTMPAFDHIGNYGISISEMRQKTRIRVDEEGTTAAGVTEEELVPTAIGESKPFHATRPFVYIITERSTSAILFIGTFAG